MTMPRDTRRRPHLVLARELSRFSYDDPAARHAAATGELIRLRRGIYARRDEWVALSAREKYLAVCRGYSASRGEPPILSHQSAAAVWGLPHIGRQPREIHVATDERRNGRRAAGVYDAVSVIDHVLHVDRFGRRRTDLTRTELAEGLQNAMPIVGFARARTRIEFAEVGASTPAESSSRVSMAFIGAPPPELQRTYPSDTGEYDVDFHWEEVDAIGEVDGKQKYLNPAFRGGRSAEQVVYDEKIREDHLRSRCRAFGRWPMEVGLDPDRLRVRLVALGVPVGVRRPHLR